MKTKDDFKRDPQENDPKLEPIILQAEKEAEAKLISEKDCIGFCHIFWATQKEILKKKYGIKWKTPAEMNPEVLFD